MSGGQIREIKNHLKKHTADDRPYRPGMPAERTYTGCCHAYGNSPCYLSQFIRQDCLFEMFQLF